VHRLRSWQGWCQAEADRDWAITTGTGARSILKPVCRQPEHQRMNQHCQRHKQQAAKHQTQCQHSRPNL
jgi:hypothetical protein